MGSDPHVIVLARPNRAGKTTASASLLSATLGVVEFVNADAIAHGLSAFRPEEVAIQAGRLMLERLDELSAAKESFAFETTLASRSFARRIRGLLAAGCQFDLFFFSLPTPDMAIERVAKRVRSGGHHVPAETIRRRHRRGLVNFFSLYMPIATKWVLYDTSNVPKRVAAGGKGDATIVDDDQTWNRLLKEYSHVEQQED